MQTLQTARKVVQNVNMQLKLANNCKGIKTRYCLELLDIGYQAVEASTDNDVFANQQQVDK